MQGRIKINRNVDMYGMAEPTVDTPTSVKTIKKDKNRVKHSAKQAALADMREEGMSEDLNLEDALIED